MRLVHVDGMRSAVVAGPFSGVTVPGTKRKRSADVRIQSKEMRPWSIVATRREGDAATVRQAAAAGGCCAWATSGKAAGAGTAAPDDAEAEADAVAEDEAEGEGEAGVRAAAVTAPAAAEGSWAEHPAVAAPTSSAPRARSGRVRGRWADDTAPACATTHRGR
jgi:hypothetical protein